MGKWLRSPVGKARIERGWSATAAVLQIVLKMGEGRMARQQLPPQIKKLAVTDRKTGKPVVRYELTVDSGKDRETGKRQQVRRRFESLADARKALTEIAGQAARGEFVPRKKITVEQVCADYVNGCHNLRDTSLAKLKYDLAPLRDRHGELPVQLLTKAHLNSLVVDLLAGGTKTAKGRTRKPWSALSVNKVISSVAQVLADAQNQGVVDRNVGESVSRVSVPYKEVDTYTKKEVEFLLASVADNRIGHALELALCGLRRGEVAGLRWMDVDLVNHSLSVVNNRVDAEGKVVENDPKSVMSRRTLPLPDRLVNVLKAARARQAAERLALGGGEWKYVVCNEAGYPYHPQVLSRYWAKAVKTAGLRHIKLHGGRHTAATHMHLMGVPMAVIAAWIGHKDSTLTQRLYAHSQDDALRSAGAVFDRVVTTP